MRIILTIATVLLIAGCAAEQQMARDQVNCESYGFRPGTPEYANCKMQLEQSRRHRAATAAAGGPAYCTGSGNSVVCY